MTFENSLQRKDESDLSTSREMRDEKYIETEKPFKDAVRQLELALGTPYPDLVKPITEDKIEELSQEERRELINKLVEYSDNEFYGVDPKTFGPRMTLSNSLGIVATELIRKKMKEARTLEVQLRNGEIQRTELKKN